ncbi:MAG: DMT family transporter [Lentihominibacter sp.]|jgi:drug/metabolite transporter (DMT)-like permease
MNKKITSNVFLMGTAIIWGFAFVAQRDSMGNMGPFMFSGIRMLLGSLTLVPIFIFADNRRKKRGEFDNITAEDRAEERKNLKKGGIAAGIIIFIAANLQQVGLVTVDAGKTAFITALYILLVPLCGIFLKNKTSVFNWIAAIIGAIGLYFLCITDSFSIAWGDLLVLIGAFFWAFHILVFDRFAPKVDVFKLVSIQFLVAGVISLFVAFATETNTLAAIWEEAPNIVYAGMLSSAIAFSLQGLGQKHANPTVASVILSTESMFGAIFGAIFLHEVLAGRELLGCILMMVAILLAQIPSPKDK